jgi:isocitrate dehydrogenase (NAD+)
MSNASVRATGPRAVTVVPGDGIGPEVVEAARRVVDATGVEVVWHVHDIGQAALDAGDCTLPDATLSSIRQDRVALKGPTATPIGTSGFASVNVGLRRRLGLYAQARPCRSRPGVPSPFGGVDLVVVRETTEDLYAGVELASGSVGAADVIRGARTADGERMPDDAALSVKFVSEAACRRVLDFAVELARASGRRRITLVHKATVMRATDGLFLEVGRDVADRTPDLEFDEMQVDNTCGQLVRRPQDFDVLVMGIQYGDIVSDLAAGLVGGIGMVPGVNHGDDAVVFEPAHGTAPRHPGTGWANPTATILCAAMLLDHLGQRDAAHRVERAVDEVLGRGVHVTADLRRPGDDRPAITTDEMTDAVIAALG